MCIYLYGVSKYIYIYIYIPVLNPFIGQWTFRLISPFGSYCLILHVYLRRMCILLLYILYWGIFDLPGEGNSKPEHSTWFVLLKSSSSLLLSGCSIQYWGWDIDFSNSYCRVVFLFLILPVFASYIFPVLTAYNWQMKLYIFKKKNENVDRGPVPGRELSP